MLRPSSAASKKALSEAVQAFTEALPGSPGEEYLGTRGIGPRTVERLRLGYVSPDAPPEGWERYAGRLAIPYVNAKSEVVWVKFRATPVNGPEADKYWQEPGGSHARLYNTQALSASGGILALAEGEFDVITLTALGIPAVGVPGGNNWKSWFNRCLQGWDRTVLFYDNDKTGRELVAIIKAKMPDIIPISAPKGYNDVGAAFQAGLGDRIVALAQGKDEDHAHESDGRTERPAEDEPEGGGQANLNGIASPDGPIPY